MLRLLPAVILLSILLLTPVSTGGSVVPAGPYAPLPQPTEYIGTRLDLPGCHCTGPQDLRARLAVFTVNRSDNRWEFTIRYNQTVIFGTITFNSPTTGKMSFNDIAYPDDRPIQYHGTPRAFDVTVTSKDVTIKKRRRRRVTIQRITIQQSGGCRGRHDLLCFTGHA
jgi:hypothetical protein